MQSNQPSWTTANTVAVIVGLIAPAADALAQFGVYTLTAGQQDAINHMIYALAALGSVIAAADAHLRAARNKAAATVQAAQPFPAVTPPAVVTPAVVKPRSHKKKVTP